MKRIGIAVLLVVGLLGCSSSPAPSPSSASPAVSVKQAPADMPSFSLAWSEYPSWSVFGVADEKKLIDGRAGWIGPLEEKWGVDIVLKLADYDACITLYGNNTSDAVCVTTLDALAPSLGRASVVIAPTSTSVGADACLSTIKDLDGLKGKTTYGLEKSVSQFVFERCLEKKGLDPKDFPFKNMDPAAAAQALQQSQPGIDAIMVWQPFVMQTERSREGVGRLFDSSVIPEEVVDSIVVGKDVLDKPGGDKFACAVLDAYYTVCRLMEDPTEGDETHIAIGKKFCNLGLDDMRAVCTQTSFRYNTPAKGQALFNRIDFRDKITPTVVEFCVSHGMCQTKPSVGWSQPDARLNFDSKYMQRVDSK